MARSIHHCTSASFGGADRRYLPHANCFGGGTGLQSAAVLSALPFTFILYMMVFVLVQELRADRKAMLTQLYRRHGETPVGADAFEAELLGDEERLRRAPSVVNRRINS